MHSGRAAIWFAVALGGAVGALGRYAVASTVGVREFPWATLAINVSGCFVLALLVAGPLANITESPASVGLTMGVLGGFTTFSTFGLENLDLLRAGRAVAAVIYLVASTFIGVAGGAFGYWIGQRL